MNTTTIKIVQHNVNGQRIASQQLREHCNKQKVSLALIQEPVYKDGRVDRFEDSRLIANNNDSGAVIMS